MIQSSERPLLSARIMLKCSLTKGVIIVRFLQDAILCLLHTFEIFVDEDFPPYCANTLQPPQKSWNWQTKGYIIL